MKIERKSETIIHLEHEEILKAVKDFVEKKINTVETVPSNAEYKIFTFANGTNEEIEFSKIAVQIRIAEES